MSEKNSRLCRLTNEEIDVLKKALLHFLDKEKSDTILKLYSRFSRKPPKTRNKQKAETKPTETTEKKESKFQPLKLE